MDNTYSLRDKKWVKAWANDKSAVMKEIFSTYYQTLWVTSLRMLADRALAEDMVQEVMAKLWQMDSLDHVKSNLGGYLHRAVVNVSLNKIKERKRWSGQENEDPP